VTENAIRVFAGATAVVTGAASGIGRALAEALAARGSDVVLADLQIALAEEAAAGIRAAGGKAEALELDVVDCAAVESVLRATVERTGRLDFMFNNAGIGVGGPVARHTIEDWRRVLDVNLRGVVNGVQASYRIMLEQGFGHIVNTASMAGLGATPGAVSYATAKHAVVGLSKSLRAEAAAEGIRVSVLCPGVVRTAILAGGGRYGKNLLDLSPEQERELWEKARPMPPAIFAGKALAAIARNQAIIIIPGWWRVFWLLDRLFPSLSVRLAGRKYRAVLARLGEHIA